MTGKPIKNPDLSELYATMSAGGRMNPEPSRALPQRAYGDPANYVEFESEKRRQVAKKLKKQKQQKYRIKGK